MPRKILLNPGPVTTSDTVKQALLVPDICPGEDDFKQVLAYIQESIKRITHANDDYAVVLFSDSGTGTLEAVIGAALPQDKKLLVISNGFYGERVVMLAKTCRVEVVHLALSVNAVPQTNEILAILDQTPDIAAIAIVHHETSTGVLNPLEDLAKIAKQYNKLFIVDAISSLGGVAIDMQKLQIDFLVSTANKCLQGFPGVSFVVARKEQLQRQVSMPKSFYFDLYAQYEALEKKLEFRFTPPIQIIYAFKQALVEYFMEGEAGRISRYRHNFSVLLAGLQELRFEPLISPAHRSQLLALVRYEYDFNFRRVHDILYSQGYVIYPSYLPIKNSLRLSVIGDLDEIDINNFLDQFSEALSQVAEES